MEINNVSGSTHNLTVKDTAGKTLTSVELPAGKTVKAEVDLRGPGVYKIYCDKPLHSNLGMNGEIIVGQ